MGIYSAGIYPAVLVVSALVVVLGGVTMAWIRAHRVLEWAVTALWSATGVQAIAVVVLLLSGNDAGLVLTIGYLLATIVILPLMGIGRLGAPDAAAADPDPNRPVLQPDQIARVDGGAAVIVGIAAAVLAWRIAVILGAA
ncbi:hypothetical protein [uncultured Demequina sp.]|uniref:hypothetical protein n=1 Tax=uncultured Demequina sp. TaxID=693499 RepID=UPI0025F0936C|nr:hypothetical protein [uncultured Demequina sp.]